MTVTEHPKVVTAVLVLLLLVWSSLSPFLPATIIMAGGVTIAVGFGAFLMLRWVHIPRWIVFSLLMLIIMGTFCTYIFAAIGAVLGMGIGFLADVLIDRYAPVVPQVQHEASPVPALLTQTTVVYCPSCGDRYPDGANFCVKCGAGKVTVRLELP